MLDHVPNLRDIGGMTTADGAQIVSGRVLRSAAPRSGDRAPQGISWPSSLVIDLRSAGESEQVHPLSHAGARIVNLPLLSALRPGTAVQSGLHGLYLVLLEQASSYLVELVHEVGLARGATLIHCAAGKDRTGVSVALLLRLLGVSRDQVVTDYRASADAELEIIARLRDAPGAAHRATLPASFFGVSVEALDGVLDVWDDHSDGVRGWFLAGGERSHLDRLHRGLLA